MRVLLIAFAAFWLLVSSAAAITVMYANGTPAVALQAWADASHVPTAPGAVVVHRARCYVDDARACTVAPGDEMWLLVRAHDLSAVFAPEQRSVFAHELGHIFDYRVMTPAARAAFQRVIGDGRPWRARGGNSAHEVFAEAYGLCLRHRSIRRTRGQGLLGYLPSPTVHRRACRVIRQAAAGALVLAAGADDDGEALEQRFVRGAARVQRDDCCVRRRGVGDLGDPSVAAVTSGVGVDAV